LAAGLAALTDLVDGPISRWLKADSQFGRLLDPLADKIFLLCVLLTVVVEGRLAWWEMALVGARDIAVVLACGVLAFGDGAPVWQKMRPRHLGKMTTAVQLGFVLAFLSEAETLARVLAIASGILGMVAFLDYVLAFRSQNNSSRQ
jgi:phosphatidylglycerophosphate synthase